MQSTAVALAVLCLVAAGDADAAGKKKRAAAAPAQGQAATDQANAAASAAYKAYEARDYATAVARAEEAVRLAPGRADWGKLLATAREAQRSERAQAAGAALYKALEQGDVAAAIRHAQAATDLAPENAGYRLALVHALLRGEQWAAADKAATEALALLPDSATPLALRAYARHRLGRAADAQADLGRAMKQRHLAAQDAQELQALAQQMARPGAAVGVPSIDCSQLEKAQTCAIFAAAPPPPAGFEAATAAYQAMGAGNAALALEQARQATAESPARSDWQLLRLQAAAQTGQWAEAEAAASAAVTAQADANLNTQVHSSLLDTGYAAMRAHRDEEAKRFFMRAIDAADTLQLRLEPRLVYDTRRTISELDRKWGVLASLTWRPGGGAVPGFGASGAGGTKALQAGAEAYWRPWGFRNGEFVELFVRGFQTLHSEGGGRTGSDTFEGAVGARWKPLSGHNAVLSLSRVFGTQVDSDWLLQAAWSLDRGTDLRVDVPNWPTHRIYAEAGRYFDRRQTYGLASFVVGRSIKVGDGNTVVFPHVVVAGEYDSALAERTAVGVGPGIGVRRWFREDKYHAPQSYVDLNLQYRAKVAGDERARGLFLTGLLSY